MNVWILFPFYIGYINLSTLSFSFGEVTYNNKKKYNAKYI